MNIEILLHIFIYQLPWLEVTILPQPYCYFIYIVTLHFSQPQLHRFHQISESKFNSISHSISGTQWLFLSQPSTRHHLHNRSSLAPTTTKSYPKKEASPEAVHLPQLPATAGVPSPENVLDSSKNKEPDSTSCEGASVCSYVGVITVIPKSLSIIWSISFSLRDSLSRTIFRFPPRRR